MSTAEMQQNKLCLETKLLLSGLYVRHYLVMLVAVSHGQEMEQSAQSMVAALESSNVSFHYYVDENVAENSVIADLTRDFSRVHHVNKRQQLRFLVFDQTTVAKLFDLDARTGVLRLPFRYASRSRICRQPVANLVSNQLRPYFSCRVEIDRTVCEKVALKKSRT